MFAISYLDLTLLFIAVGVAQAYTVFNPACTTPSPDKPANFVGSPDTRGTLDILWSSLFTIFACTWSVQHLNVPEQREGQDPGWLGSIWWKLKDILLKSGWMIVTVIAPEYIVATGLGCLFIAKNQKRAMKEFAHQDGVKWTMVHCLFADMGGFVIRHGTGTAPATEEIPSDVENKDNISKHGSIEESPGIQIRDRAINNDENASALEAGLDNNSMELHEIRSDIDNRAETSGPTSASSWPNPYYLDGRQIIALRSQKHLKKLPRITKEEINDKSKGDNFSKAITVGQIIWTIIQVCVRGARGLAIAQLEIAVLAFSSCAIFIYAIQWLKPKDVGVPMTLVEYDGPIPVEVLALLDEKSSIRTRKGGRILNERAYYGKEHGNAQDMSNVGLVLGCLVFGAPHIGAWNFEFPTMVEQTIWRATSLYCTCLGILILLIVYLPFTRDVPDPWVILFIVLFAGLYILARLFILVEIFRTLCFLPASGYVSTWTSNLPNVG